MNFKDHALIGAATGLVTGACFLVYSGSWPLAIMQALTVFLGSLAPDLDTDSIPSRWTARIGFVVACIFMLENKYFPAAIIGSAFMLMKCGKHRGMTHKYYLPFILFGAAAFFSNFLFAAFGIGILVHLKADKIVFLG